MCVCVFFVGKREYDDVLGIYVWKNGEFGREGRWKVRKWLKYI